MKNMILLGSVFSILLATAARAAETTATAYDIIVVAGQSNAEGMGEGPTSDDTSLDSKIFQLGRKDADNLKAVPAKDPLQSWSYPNNKVSFGMSFARAYAARSLAAGRKVLLVPVALGGSSILVWEKSQTLFQDMTNRVNAALKQNPANRVVAFLWHQAETDILFIENKAPGMNSADIYEQKLQQFLTDVRTAIPSNPLYPIVMGEPVPSWLSGKKSRCQVMKKIKNLAKSNAQVYYAGATGFTSNKEDRLNDDVIHFSARSQTAYGKRYYQVFSTKKSYSTDDKMFCF